tara:strand:+ start:296 stop:1624 length:1329 start_codon:yes stop_codon:yes gene_type:complete
MSNENNIYPIPTGRFKRFLGLSKTTLNIAGNIALKASKNYISKKNVDFKDLLLTKENFSKFVNQLSIMRGAALKVGQLMSLETGDFLPKEVNEILSTCRNQAYAMPKKQLIQVLKSEWGDDFETKFSVFQYMPVAAASIGQVHKVQLKETSETLAVKIQYPGIRDSIDNDIDNLGLLLENTKLLPPSIDIKNLLDIASYQLNREACYITEIKYLEKFYNHFLNDHIFEVPKPIKKLSTNNIICMEFKSGVTIDKISSMSQKEKENIFYNLVELLFSEIFELRCMQTDPNYANFLYNVDRQKIVLLDFGSCVDINHKKREIFSKLLSAIVNKDRELSKNILFKLKVIDDILPNNIKNEILENFYEISEELISESGFDFKETNIIDRMNGLSEDILKLKKPIGLPDSEILLIQRKISGLFFLARKLEIKLKINNIVLKYCELKE